MDPQSLRLSVCLSVCLSAGLSARCLRGAGSELTAFLSGGEPGTSVCGMTADSNLPIAPGTSRVTNACYLGMLAGGGGPGEGAWHRPPAKPCQGPSSPPRVPPPIPSWGATELD